MLIRLVIADDHPRVLQSLALLLRQEPDFKVLACCQDGDEALQMVGQYRPDIAVLDADMPGKDSLAVLCEVHQAQLPTRVVLLTADLEEDKVLEAIGLGVSGVILKEMAAALLVPCIRKVYAGDQWLEKRCVERILDKMLQREASLGQIAKVLTPRELDGVRLAASGLRNKEIADKLAIGEGTVKLHLHRSYRKLHLDSRVALLLYAQSKGLV